MELNVSKQTLFEKTIATDAYISEFCDKERFEALCRECPNYGRRWGCPPFNDNPQPDLSAFDNVKLYLLKIDLDPAEFESTAALETAMRRVVQCTRIPYEKKMLMDEKATNGRAALFTGMCPHCGERECARTSGRPCVHPAIVRPSLEALGFDLGKTAEEIFGIKLEWGADKKAPTYLCLIGAVFHN